jgi:hypothetical protein
MAARAVRPPIMRLVPELVDIDDPEDAGHVAVALELLEIAVPESFLAANRISFFPKSKTATTFFKNASPQESKRDARRRHHSSNYGDACIVAVWEDEILSVVIECLAVDCDAESGSNSVAINNIYALATSHLR